MSFEIEIFDTAGFAGKTAGRIAAALPDRGSVVLTGGTTAEKVYEPLARATADWSGVEVMFSDERCVPPDAAASNYGMTKRLLLDPAGVERVHRMRGEDDPEAAAHAYREEIRPLVEAGIDLVLLGMGADGHVCALFPGSPALDERDALCIPVERPDGMKGLTLTPPAVSSAKHILLLVAGGAKAATVVRAIRGNDDPDALPVRLLAGHPHATFLLDEEAASLLRTL